MTLKDLKGTLQDIKEDIKNGIDNRSPGFYLMDCHELKSLIEEVIRYRKEKKK